MPPAAGSKGGMPSFGSLRFILVLLIVFGFASVFFLMAPIHSRTGVWDGRAAGKLRLGRSTRSFEDEDEEDEEGADEEEEEEGVEAVTPKPPKAPKAAAAAVPARAEPGAAAATTAKPMSMEERLSKGRLYFLFMLQDSLPHAEIWKAFFSGAPKGSYKAFAHCTKQDVCRKLPAFAQLEIELVPTIASKWCVDLVSPSWQLVRAALKSEADGGEGPRKFVLISDTTLPIQPMPRIRQVLLKADHSDFCISPQNEWASVRIFGVTYSIVKHHQWAVLNREDAQAFVSAWERLSSYSQHVKGGAVDLSPGQYQWDVPRMGANGRANFSEVVPRALIPAPGRCPDEEVLTSFIFGLHEHGKEHIWTAIQSQTVCRTYVNWACKNPPEVFSKITDKLRDLSQDSRDSAYLFARKFKKDAPLKDLKTYLTKANKKP